MRTGQSRGCGKVEYASCELAEKAVQQLNGQALGAQQVSVEPMASDRRRASAVVVTGLKEDMDEGLSSSIRSRFVAFSGSFRALFGLSELVC